MYLIAGVVSFNRFMCRACVKLWSEVKDQIKSSDDNNHEDIDIGTCVRCIQS